MPRNWLLPVDISPHIMPSAMAKKPSAHSLQSLLQVFPLNDTFVHVSVYNVKADDDSVAI